jgi:CPA2 family monovalent cation:H+ antiporter-2
VVLLSVKSLVIGAATWAGGATAPVAALTGLLLSQAGEFSLVILSQASLRGLIAQDAQSVLFAVVVLTLVLTTPMYELGKRIQPRLIRVPPARWITNPALHEPLPAAAAAPGGEGEPGAEGAGQTPPTAEEPLPYPHRLVIIAGFGVVGRNIAEHFSAAGVPFAVIELNPRTVMRQQKLGRRFVFGDVSNPDVLESAGIHEAEAVILTIPDDEAVLRACRTIRELAPNVFIAARTTYLSRAIAATELGANYVCVEEVATAQDMARQVMERLARRLVEQP